MLTHALGRVIKQHIRPHHERHPLCALLFRFGMNELLRCQRDKGDLVFAGTYPNAAFAQACYRIVEQPVLSYRIGRLIFSL